LARCCWLLLASPRTRRLRPTRSRNRRRTWPNPQRRRRSQHRRRSPLASWLVGSWSAEANCSSDFIAHYNADGSLQYGEDSGRWTIAGDALTETVTERFTMESDAPQKLTTPETRTYTVTKLDAGHGTITFNGRKVPIQRC
jgi:hypothetical protein